MQFLPSFLIVCVVSTVAETLIVDVSLEKVSWTKAKSFCAEGQGANGLFNDCQPNECDPNTLPTLNDDIDDGEMVWLNGYVLRSPVMQYHGCFKIAAKNETISKLQKEEFLDNSVMQCSRFCKVNESKFIMLTNTECYCLTGVLMKAWKLDKNGDEPYISEVSTKSCMSVCQENKDKWCFGDVAENILSIYEYKTDEHDTKVNVLGKTCFYTDAHKTHKVGSCRLKMKYKCQELTITGSERHWQSECSSTFLNWYQANNFCKQKGHFLQTYEDHKCPSVNDDSENMWYNKFMLEQIIWNKEGNPPSGETNCLALKKSNGNFTLTTADCSHPSRVLCRKSKEVLGSTNVFTTVDGVPTAVANVSTSIISEQPNRNKSESGNSLKIAFIVAGVVIALVILIVAIICLQRKNNDRKNVHDQVVYYSTVNSTVPLVGEGESSHSIKGNYTDIEDNVYNHLGDRDYQTEQEQNHAIYDHSGEKQNGYDLVKKSAKNRENMEHNVYDISHNIESVYDKSGEHLLNQSCENHLALIYDHSRQVENAYDVTDSCNEHKRNSPNSPVYELSRDVIGSY